LGSERNNGMGMGYIPITRITQYAIQEGIHDVEMFKRIISRVDHLYYTMVTDKQEQKSKSKPKTGKK